MRSPFDRAYRAQNEQYLRVYCRIVNKKSSSVYYISRQLKGTTPRGRAAHRYAVDNRSKNPWRMREQMNSGDHVTFRERLRTLRKLQGVTLRELASRAAVSASLISNIENARTNPSVAAISKICNALGVEVADILAPEELVLGAQKPEDRELLDAAGGVHKSVLLRERERGVSLYEVTMPAESSTGGLRNPAGSVDFIIVLNGRVTVQFAGTRVALEAGHSLRFHSDLDHCVANETVEEAKFHWLALDTAG